MALSPEEQRALEYRESFKRRKAFQRMLQARLKAPAGPANQTKRNWAPLRRT